MHGSVFPCLFSLHFKTTKYTIQECFFFFFFSRLKRKLGEAEKEIGDFSFHHFFLNHGIIDLSPFKIKVEF